MVTSAGRQRCRSMRWIRLERRGVRVKSTAARQSNDFNLKGGAHIHVQHKENKKNEN